MSITRLLLLAPLFFSTATRAEPPASSAADLALQTLAAVDVFAEHHPAAPPRQEIVRKAIAEMRTQAGFEQPIGIGPQLAQLTSDDEFLELLTQEWRQVRAKIASGEVDESLQSILLKALRRVISDPPGRNLLSDRQTHGVEEQLAANRYVGTGIQLETHDGVPRMLHVVPDGPADNVGARDNDAILEIDGASTEGQSLTDVVRALRGEAGSEVEVLLQQGHDEPRRYTITRGVVPIRNTRHERREQDGVSIEVIRFDRITAATVSDLRRIEQEWTTPPDAVLLDLQRSSPDLHHGVLLADALLKGGTIGVLRTVEGSRTFEAGRDALFADIPLFAIVSGMTSGSIEWVAAALQDQGRATILGQQTAGDPFVSESFDVPGTNMVLTLATGILRRADGRLLVRTPSPRRRPAAAIAIKRADGTSRSVSRKREHDGGVIPVKSIATKDKIPVQSEFASRPFVGGPVEIDAAIEIILPLLQTGKDAPEAD